MTAYRDYRLTRQGPDRWPLFALAIVAAGLAAGAAYLGSNAAQDVVALRTAIADATAGDLDAAGRGFHDLADSRLLGASGSLGLGWVSALRGDLDSAEVHFNRAGERRARFFSLSFRDEALRALELGQFPLAEVLSRVAVERDASDELQVIHGMAANGLDDIAGAHAGMSAGPRKAVFERVRRGGDIIASGALADPRVLRLYQGHVEELVEKQRTGARAYAFDREGRPLFKLTLATGNRTDVADFMRSLVDDGSGLDAELSAFDRRNRVQTTIDRGLQSLAYRALRGRRGVIVIADLDGAIRAAAGRDDRGRNVEPPDPLHEVVDIASISKLITLAAAYDSSESIEQVFPFTCEKPLQLDGDLFYDWNAHGLLIDPDAALAVSCNLAYGNLALEIGREALISRFARFGFGAVPGATGLDAAYLEQQVATDLDLVHLGVGIEIARATLVHTTMIALAVATGGELRRPFIVEQRTVVGSGLSAPRAPEPASRVLTVEQAARMTRAMIDVVADPNGTGRNAAPRATILAIKTGTAGDGRRGLDPVITGFFPAERPRYAFTVYLPAAGRSSGAASDVTRELVDSIVALNEKRSSPLADGW